MLCQSKDLFKPPSNLQQSHYCVLRETIWNAPIREEKDFLFDSLSASATISQSLNQWQEEFVIPLISTIAKIVPQTSWTSLWLFLPVFRNLSIWSYRDCYTINQMNERGNHFTVSAFLDMNCISQKEVSNFCWLTLENAYLAFLTCENKGHCKVYYKIHLC